MLEYSQFTIFYMTYYNIRQTFFICSSTIKVEETNKIDKFLNLLSKSGVCDLLKETIDHVDSKGGRPTYNPYNLLATILYSFAFSKASLRNIYKFQDISEDKLYYIEVSILLHILYTK